jgi:hypothetical protein
MKTVMLISSGRIVDHMLDGCCEADVVMLWVCCEGNVSLSMSGM